MKKCVHVQSWSGANFCKGLKVPLCLIPLMQILFPHYMEINNIYIEKEICSWTLLKIHVIVMTLS